MSIQSDLETALLKLLQQEKRLSGVKTFEADIRDCLFTGEKLTQGFRIGEMPAINLSATLDPTLRSPFTAAEVQHEVPISIVVITAAQKRKPAFDAAKELQEAVECVLDRLRKSNNGLGGNAFLFDKISSSVTTLQESPHCFAVGATAAKITKITPLA